MKVKSILNSKKVLMLIAYIMFLTLLQINSVTHQLNQKLEDDHSGYCEIDRMSSSDVFQIMTDFTEQLANPTLKAELLNALNKKKPFREFKQIIDNAGNFRQEWFDFKNESYYHWIAKQLRDSNNETTDNESSQPEIG